MTRWPKRVGIASNSHRAINLLLAETWDAARKMGIACEAVKVCNQEDQMAGVPDGVPQIESGRVLFEFEDSELRQLYRAALGDVKAAELRLQSIKASRLPTVTAGFDDGKSGFTPAHNVWIEEYQFPGNIAMPVAGPSTRNPNTNYRIEFLRLGGVPTST